MRVFRHISGIFSVLSFTASEKLDCSKKGSYLGNVSKTESGKLCQRWNVNQPHRVKHHPVDGNKEWARNTLLAWFELTNHIKGMWNVIHNFLL